MIVLYAILTGMAGFCITMYLYFYVTGRYHRSYNWIPFYESIELNSTNILSKDLLEQYKPIIYQDDKLRGPKPQKIYAECIKDRTMIVLVYRVYWETEQYPYLLLNRLYTLFRSVFYGSKADIEFVQVRLNTDQKILEIKFESDPSNNPDVLVPQHLLTSFTPDNDSKEKDSCKLNTITWALVYNDERYMKKTLRFEKIGNNSSVTHVAMRVFTWNHLYSIKQDFSRCQSFDLPLEDLTESIYRKLKMTRRSWADFGKPLDITKSILQGIFFSITVFLIIFLLCLRIF